MSANLSITIGPVTLNLNLRTKLLITLILGVMMLCVLFKSGKGEDDD